MTDQFPTRFIKRVFSFGGYTLSFIYTAILSWLLFKEITGTAPPMVSDKIKHFGAFGLLGTTWYLVFWSRDYLWTLKGSMILCSIYAIFTEIVQYYLPYRSYETGDVIADIVGVVTATLICSKIFPVDAKGDLPQ